MENISLESGWIPIKWLLEYADVDRIPFTEAKGIYNAVEKWIDILETLKQEDYERWIYMQGLSVLSEEQWDYIINNAKNILEEKVCLD